MGQAVAGGLGQAKPLWVVAAGAYAKAAVLKPAQALGDRGGETTIRDLRSEAERALGERFDVREFHQRVLAQGQVPLDLLRERIRAWIKKSH